MVDSRATTFADAMSTALISCFEVGSQPKRVRLRKLKRPGSLRSLDRGGAMRSRETLKAAERWGPLLRSGRQPSGQGLVPLGEIVRVSRGVATGCNGFFVLTRESAEALGLMPWMVPALSRAQEVIGADGVVRDGPERKLLLAPPRDTDLSAPENSALADYLASGERAGVPDRYLCRHRRPWWRISFRRPSVVATYMARQPPHFALNPDRVAILNVFHGFYARVDLDAEQLAGLVSYLNVSGADAAGNGRTYVGGLTKLEPGEMEAVLVPGNGARRGCARVAAEWSA